MSGGGLVRVRSGRPLDRLPPQKSRTAARDLSPRRKSPCTAEQLESARRHLPPQTRTRGESLSPPPQKKQSISAQINAGGERE